MSQETQRSPLVLVGVDAADQRHEIHAGHLHDPEILTLHVSNDVSGLDHLLAALEQRWPGAVRGFAFEDPAGPFALALQARGELVYSTNPHALQDLRRGLNPSGKKDDPEDARAAYVYLRENLAQLTPSTPNSTTGARLRARVLERLELVQEKTRLLNRLTATLKTTYPVVLQLFEQLDQDVTLAFLARWPEASTLSELTQPEFLQFLRSQRYPRAQTAVVDLWACLQRPQLPLPEGVALVARERQQRVLAQLQLLRQQLKELEREITALFAKHPDRKVFASLPGGGRVLAPALLALFGDDRAAWANVAHLCAQCGTVPVTQRSGKRRSVHFRFHCDRDRRYLLHLFANGSRRKCAWAQAFYRSQRERGKSHATALRNLATKWLRIIWRMWHDRTEYQAEQVGRRGRAGSGADPTDFALTST